jgi:glycosyltransferase involved in cell wall biosynthesis
MLSVVVPAHDEASVIGRCLAAMTRGAAPGELEIIVVCNGCSDDTAEVARRHGAPVRVIETPVASKNAALNLGDAAARGFPRFFVDADVVLPLASLRATAEALREGRYLAAAPRLRVDLAGCSLPVRLYHDVWMSLPYVQEGMLGSGVYALSEAGRARIGRWPDIIADDDLVRLAFRREERVSVPTAWFEVTPPRTLRSLIHINIRRRAGTDEMRAIHPEALAAETRDQYRAFLRLWLRPRLWPALAVYTWAKLATLAGYAWKKSRGRHKEWNRDATTH